MTHASIMKTRTEENGQAAEIVIERQVRRLPVVDRDKRLVGIVALGDFAVESLEIRPAARVPSKVSKPF